MGSPDLNCLYFEKFCNLLERYELVKEIGQGGQAMVFQCRSKSDTMGDFACKSIFKGLNSMERFDRLEDLRLEVEVMRKVAGHHGVVCLKEVIIDDGFWHLIMELCECSLYDRIERKGRLSEQEAALLIQSLTRIVQDLHAIGVVHRDLKPGNVLITLGGKPYDVKVADFGLSACFTGSDPCFTEKVGTPRYYAPEVLQGRYSKEIDIWGLGVILYEALTGILAFSELDNEEVENRLSNDEDLAVSHLDWPVGIVSEEAKHLVLAMMQVKPEKRISCEQILSHPWVIKHSESLNLKRSTNVKSNLRSRRDICAYINKVKLRRAKGECRVNSKSHGHLGHSTKEVKPEKQENKHDERPQKKREYDETSGSQEVASKRIKLQMFNGMWKVVKPCALVC